MAVANLRVSSNHCTGLLTLSGGAEVVSLSFLGPSLFPTLFPEVDQFLKGETNSWSPP